MVYFQTKITSNTRSGMTLQLSSQRMPYNFHQQMHILRNEGMWWYGVAPLPSILNEASKLNKLQHFVGNISESPNSFECLENILNSQLTVLFSQNGQFIL